MAKTYFERFAEGISYYDLGEWCIPNITGFSHDKKLFSYQENAIVNLAKVLYSYYTSGNGKETLFSNCVDLGMEDGSFNVYEFERRIDKRRGLTNKRFSLFLNYYEPIIKEDNTFIAGYNFFNRVAFWMATGSGKSMVLIKTIEYLNYLQWKGLIPEKDIMLLLPRKDLIEQFKNEVFDYNRDKEIPIELVDLKDYEEDKFYKTLLKSIKIYYYRSDLIRDERKENILDFKDYDNNGNWYVLLDEAHRGETGTSAIQDYISILSRNGFLFNFSATFTDAIDYATTCYNYNLEKFIKDGYGKNIYLSESYFNFRNQIDDFNEREKQKQVLKSLITLATIKKAKREGMYHNPLMLTLVNTINTDESDLLLFFKKLEEIAVGNMDNDLFYETKVELKSDFQYKSYVFGDEKCDFKLKLISDITMKDLLTNIFNAKTGGKIEILEGEEGKELVLKLETSENPFALIKIGDADKFQREKLGDNYSYIKSYETRNYFKNINRDENINILLGSRGFYEGWDSNRPNVINFINIGGSDAKKYVLQALGRGIRIEPYRRLRKRLPLKDVNKSNLLETLFVYATDRKGVETVLDTIDEQKVFEEHEINIFESNKKPFDLLMPVFMEAEEREDIARYGISNESKTKLKDYFTSIDKNVFMLKTGVNETTYELLNKKISDESLFETKQQKYFNDYNMLLKDLVNHVNVKNKVVNNVKILTDEIKHFKHIKVINFNEHEIKKIEDKINNVRNYRNLSKQEIETKYKNAEISFDEAIELVKSKDEESFIKNEQKIIIKRIAKHYYIPLIYSKDEKVEYIKNIIKVESEVIFLKNLIKYLETNEVKSKWMFSKIVENIDRFYMEYYDKANNKYKRFYPDYVFWLVDGTKYKIIFIDPKSTTYTSYQNKADEFERIFLDRDGKEKQYYYKNYTITFDLKLITKDKNTVTAKYKDYWLGIEDFGWLK